MNPEQMAKIEADNLELAEDRIFLDCEETLKKFGLPESCMYCVVEKDNPTHVIGFPQGKTFTVGEEYTVPHHLIEYYKVHMTDGCVYGIFADSDDTAKFLLFESYNLELVMRLEKEQIFASIVWAPQA